MVFKMSGSGHSQERFLCKKLQAIVESVLEATGIEVLGLCKPTECGRTLVVTMSPQ